MSGEIINDSKIKLSMSLIYRRQIIVKSCQFIGLFYVVYGIFVAFAGVCINLDKKANEKGQMVRFWDPIVAIYSLANFSVFCLTAYYKYWNCKKGYSKLISLPVDHMIVCFILAPLFFFSSIDLIIEVAKDLIVIPCYGYLSFLIPLTFLLIFVSAAILIFDIGQNVPLTSNWKMNLLKTNVIFFTVIGVANCFVISFSMQHMLIFRNESLNSTYKDKFQPNDSCVVNNPTRNSINDIYIKCDKYLRSTVLLFCVCSFAYLIQPMLQRQKSEHMIELHSHSIESMDTDIQSISTQEQEENETISDIVDNGSQIKLIGQQQNPSFRLPSAALVLCIIFLSLSFLSFIIMLSLNESASLKIIGGLIFTTFPIFVYALGSALSIVHIKEVGKWPIFLDRHGKVIEKCLIWIGAAGQLSISMATVACSIELLVTSNSSTLPTETARNVLLIPNNLLIVFQTFLQTILISLAIDRKWVRPEINSWAELLCPAVGMMGLNIGLLLLSISEMNIPIINDGINSLFMDLFYNGLKSIGGTLSTLQRLHASILFASMIVYTHN